MALQDEMLRYRAKNNLSTKVAAQMAGISHQTWRYVEKGLQDAQPITITKIKLLLEKGAENESINQQN